MDVHGQSVRNVLSQRMIKSAKLGQELVDGFGSLDAHQAAVETAIEVTQSVGIQSQQV